MDCDETFQNITESCFGLDVANRKRPGPQIRVMQVSLQLVVPGQCGNDRDESNYDAATCCQNTCERVGAGNEPAINETRQQYAQVHGRSLPNQSCHSDQRATQKHQTPKWLLLPLQEGKNAQCEWKRGKNLAVRTQRVTWPVSMDENDIANATPRSCPVVRQSRTDSPQHEGGGHDDKYGEDVDRTEVVPPSYSENAGVNVIHARWLCIHRSAIERATVQDIVCDRAVIGLIGRVQRRK